MSAPAPVVTARPRWLWASLVVPIAAWVVAEMTCAALATEACRHGHPALARGLTGGITATMLALTAATTGVAYRALRRLERAPDADTAATLEPSSTLALTGVVLGCVFTLALLWNGLPALLVRDLCGAAQ